MSTSETNPAPETPNPRRSTPPRAKQSVPISVFLGIMAVPLAAAASMFLVSPQIEESAALAADSAVAESAEASVPDIAQDLLVACGPVAMEMIELEKAEGLTTLQSAALDALRPICAQEGMPLSEASGSPTVQAVLTRSNPAVVTSTSSSSGDDVDDDWDDSDDFSEDWDDSLDSDDSSDDWDD
ncbi:hypothetical protein BH23ACT4_BH23ACT4_12130 [soil metagenome]